MDLCSCWDFKIFISRKKTIIEKMEKQEMEIQEKRKQFLLLAWRNSLLLDKNSFTVSHSKTFSWTPKRKLQLHWRCSVKKVFLKASQNLQGSTYAGVSLFLETFLKYVSTLSFLCKVCEFLQGIHLVEHLRTTVSAWTFFSRTVPKTSKDF